MAEENKMADVPTEGDINLSPQESGNENPEGSPDETNDEEGTQTPEGEEKTPEDPDKNLPFHEHPRWKQREVEWDQRFNDQEKRHQDDLQALREEFAGARKENANQTEIPAWFGGNQQQWDEYRKFNDQQLQAAEDRAFKRMSDIQAKQDKAVAEATEYMRSEMTFIEGDKTLNPSGAKVDPNRLLKIVMDNDLVDSQGRWNYRAGWRIMQQAVSGQGSGNRKTIAGATTSESKAESKPAPYKTSADFKENKPW